MKPQFDEVASGLYVRRNTPRRVRVTDEFVEEVCQGEPESFRQAIKAVQAWCNARLGKEEP